MKKLTLLLLFGIAAFARAQTPSGMLPYTAIDHPEFVAAPQVTFLLDDDILLAVASGKVARAYPAADLAQHGVVFDEMPDGPISVTWCGVCNTGAVFRAEVNGRRLHFEYDSMHGANEVDRDRETGSRWQQSTGEAISGPLKGSRLELYPFVRTTWKEWRRRYPKTTVLKPLPGYDARMPNLSKRIKEGTIAGNGEAPKGAFGNDNRLRPKEPVAGLRVGKDAKAYPFSQLRIARVVNDRVGGLAVLVVHQPSSDTTTAFEARVKDRVLRFQANNADASSLVDLETRSSWDAYGLCLKGPLKGTKLKTLTLISEFWFAWSEFHPQTEVFIANSTKAQSVSGKPVWETLLQKPLPEDSEPKISVISLPVPLAPPSPLPPGPGHTHAGPVFAYVLEGEIENQVEPDPLEIYKAGGFFYEAPMHVHKLLRNLSMTEPAKLIVFQAGATGQAVPRPGIKTFLQEPLLSTANQELSLLKLTLAPGVISQARAHSGPGVVYVLEGKIETSGAPDQPKTYSAGDLFLEPVNRAGLTFRNASGNEPAKLLLYQVSEKRR